MTEFEVMKKAFDRVSLTEVYVYEDGMLDLTVYDESGHVAGNYFFSEDGELLYVSRIK